MRAFCAEIVTTLWVLEEGILWANRAELYIGLIKEAVQKDMKESTCPLTLWDYCVEQRTRINNLTAKDSFKLNDTIPHTALTCEKGDILSCILGPAKGEGNKMAQWVMKGNDNGVPR
eukprot:15325094-Ditylum_brightwellii.AAC.1